MSLKDSPKSSVSQEREQRRSVLTNNEMNESGNEGLLEDLKTM
jgi:hypothetical protein